MQLPPYPDSGTHMTIEMKKPRNLIVIMADEHRRDALGCMGHPIARTPNLDALARRGALFENAYTPSPICVSARAALATGVPVHQTGHWDSAAPYCGTPHSWMHAARDAGCEVVSFGKLHFRSNTDDNGFSREVLPMHVTNGVGWTVGLLRKQPPAFDAASELAMDVGAGETSYTNYDLDVTHAARQWLQARRGDDQPWATFVSFVSPHYPLRAPQRFLDLYSADDMSPPIAYAADERPTHPELQALARYWDYDRYFDEKTMRQAKAAYFALVSFVDECVGRVLSALDASGQRDNTLVVYTSDHGEMLGDHGFWTKSVMYEASTGIPMIVQGSGVPEGRKVQTPASLLDIAATAMDLLVPTQPLTENALPGRSLRLLASEPDDPDRTAFSEYHDGGSTTGSFMVRWSRWKFVHYANMRPQLFDLQDDPLERHDMADSLDPHVAAALDEGRRRLLAICDPEAVNTRVFADQRDRIDKLGGTDACKNMAFNHTEVPAFDG